MGSSPSSKGSSASASPKSPARRPTSPASISPRPPRKPLAMGRPVAKRAASSVWMASSISSCAMRGTLSSVWSTDHAATWQWPCGKSHRKLLCSHSSSTLSAATTPARVMSSFTSTHTMRIAPTIEPTALSWRVFPKVRSRIAPHIPSSSGSTKTGNRSGRPRSRTAAPSLPIPGPAIVPQHHLQPRA